MDAPRLLVVDDSRVNLHILSGLLQSQGYPVATALSGPEALTILDNQEIALVLLDLVMDGMDGFEVLRIVRQTRSYLDLPILIVSASGEGQQIVQAIDLGANDYLTKPINNDVLMAKIRRNLAARPAPAPATLPADLKTGDTVAQYRLLEVLGEGGMGRVYRAFDTRLERNVALKLLLERNPDPRTRARFAVEARAVARVTHPNVVTIYEVAENPVPFLAMELIEGVTLDDEDLKLPIDVASAVAWTLDILDALGAVHALQIVHRDLKPGNIMVTPRNRIKVMDFGLAKILETSQEITTQGQVLGTPQFMSPEHFDPSMGAIDNRSDLFAVAGIFYLLLTGSRPFPEDHPARLLYAIVTRQPAPMRDFNPDVPAALESVVLKGLAKQQSERYQNAGEFAEALRAAYTSSP